MLNLTLCIPQYLPNAAKESTALQIAYRRFSISLVCLYPLTLSKTPKSPHLEDEAGAAGFGKPELDSQGTPRQRSKEETITNKSTALHDIVIFPVPAEMPDYGSNRGELQGEAKVSFIYSS